MEAGYPQKALQQFSKVLNHFPNSPRTLNHRGLAFNRLGLYKQAIEDFSRALQFDKHQADVFLNRGVAYMKSGDKAEAKKDLDQAINLNRSLPQAYESRGLIALMDGDSRQAIQDFTSAIRLGSDGGLIHYNHAVALEISNQIVAAKKEYELACEREIFQACGKLSRPTPVRHILYSILTFNSYTFKYPRPWRERDRVRGRSYLKVKPL